MPDSFYRASIVDLLRMDPRSRPAGMTKERMDPRYPLSGMTNERDEFVRQTCGYDDQGLVGYNDEEKKICPVPSLMHMMEVYAFNE